jgi:hypothetical protein
VLRFEEVSQTPLNGVTVAVTSLRDYVASERSANFGEYLIPNLPLGSVFDLQLELPQEEPVRVPLSVSTRVLLPLVTAPGEHEVDLPLVRFSWLAQTAADCGIFPDLNHALYDNADASAQIINPYFVGRSTIVGFVRDEDGNPLSGVERSDITVTLDGYVNTHDGAPDETFVCFLDGASPGSDGRLVGTTSSTSTEAGGFVVFRVRDPITAGAGVAEVEVEGVGAATVVLDTGNIGVVQFEGGGIEVDPRPEAPLFERDIYPLFAQLACVTCHAEGKLGYELAPARDGYRADWSTSADEVYEALLAPSQEGCETGEAGMEARVCLVAPDMSLLLRRPLREYDTIADHPNVTFNSPEDLDYQMILRWIQNGAPR